MRVCGFRLALERRLHDKTIIMASSVLRSSLIRKALLSLPFTDPILNILRNTLISTLKLGPVPQHVAFVMDGNRRFAREHQIETVEGHYLGFEALARILEVCYKTGVKVVTIYAFSIENFKRSKYEVDALMEMARVKLVQMAQHGDLCDQYGASIRILGQTSLVKPEVLEAIDQAVDMTKHNNRAVLNVCFPYTSRDEITTAIRDTVAEFSTPMRRQPRSVRQFSEHSITRNINARRLSVLQEEDSPRPLLERSTESLDSQPLDPTFPQSKPDRLPTPPPSEPASLPTPPTSQNHSPESSPSQTPTKLVNSSLQASFRDPETITTDSITSHLFTSDCPPLDILIRTSGVERLSDFMLWQCHERTSVVFLKCLWPDFDLWQFLPVLVEWQWWRMRAQQAQSRLA